MKTIFAVGFFAVLALFNTASFAASKLLPGSACQVRDENYVDLYRAYTEITSVSGNTYDISCPILRDNPSVGGLSALRLYLYKGDTATKTCIAHAVDAVGNILATKSVSVSGSGNKVFDWTNTFQFSPNSTTAFYNVSCTLGSSSGAPDIVQNLYWTETTESGSTNKKTMPGMAARASSVLTKVQRGDVAVWADDASGNTNPSVWMHLPVMRDTFSTTNTLTALNVRVYRGDPNYQGTCTLWISDNWQNQTKMLSKPFAAMGNNNLTWTNAEMKANLLSGFYNIECDMSPDDVIYGYYWSE